MFFAYGYMARRRYLDSKKGMVKLESESDYTSYKTSDIIQNDYGRPGYGQYFYLNFTDRPVGVLTPVREIIRVYPKTPTGDWAKHAGSFICVHIKDRLETKATYDYVACDNIGTILDVVPSKTIDNNVTGFYVERANCVVTWLENAGDMTTEIESLIPDAALLSKDTYGINFTILSRAKGPSFMVLGTKIVPIRHVAHDGECKLIWQERYTKDGEYHLDADDTVPLQYKEMSMSKAYNEGMDGIRFFRTFDDANGYAAITKETMGKNLSVSVEACRKLTEERNQLAKDKQELADRLDHERKAHTNTKLKAENAQAKAQADVGKSEYGFKSTMMGFVNTVINFFVSAFKIFF